MRGSVPRRRECAIVATKKGWAASAARVLRAHGYAVANMPDLHYADLLVAAGELRIVMLDNTELRQQSPQIAQLRRRHDGIVFIAVGDASESLPTGESLLRVRPLDDQQLQDAIQNVRAETDAGTNR